jgi:hypothetical protein
VQGTRSSPRSGALSEKSDPERGAYSPYVAARRPDESPQTKPLFRVLVHHRYLDEWNSLADRVGIQNAQRFWDHVAHKPGEAPDVGQCSVMKGKHNGPKWAGYSRTIHYEVSGAGRIDYQYNAASTEGALGDAHPVVKILVIDLGSH